jgi:hypothetical protein
MKKFVPSVTPFVLPGTYGKDPSKKFKVVFVEHSSAESVVLGFFRHKYDGVSDKKILNKRTDFTVFMDKEYKKRARVRDVVQTVIDTGLWGYCHHKSKKKSEIHYWIQEDSNAIDILTIIEMFSHEMAHASGYKEEDDAQRIGGISSFVVKTVAEDIAPGRIKISQGS